MRKTLPAMLASVVLTFALACGERERDADLEVTAHRDMASLDSLILALKSHPGRFVRGRLPRSWEFEGDVKLFESIAVYADSAVVRLVDCLSDSQPAVATVESRPVLVGVMCYRALVWTAYHERAPEAGPWLGRVEPTATATQLHDAKAAWKEVVSRGDYFLQ